MAVSHVPDWLTRLADWSQFAGALLALAALLIAAASVLFAIRAARAAKSSADDAGRTATAAEATAGASSQLADIAREQLEMLKAEADRRPEFEIRSVDWRPRDWQAGVLRVGLMNVGDLDADDTVLNLLIPIGSTIQRCDENGNDLQRVPTLTTTEPFLEGDSETTWTYAIVHARVPRNIATVAHFYIRFVGSGQLPVKIKLAHPLANAERTELVEVHDVMPRA